MGIWIWEGGAQLGLIIKLKHKSFAKKAFKLGWIECTRATDNRNTFSFFKKGDHQINATLLKRNPAILSNIKRNIK